MAGISSLGIGSGLDLNALVKNLVEAERAPKTNQLDRREANLTSKLSAFGTLRGSISDVAGSLDALKDLSPGRFASSSNSSAVSVSATADAPLASYQVEVNNLASAQSLASDSFASRTDAFGQGTLDITLGDGSTAQVVIGPDDDSLEGIRDAINNADLGVSASIVNDGAGFTLTLSSSETGLENRVSEIVVTESGAAGLGQLAFSESGGASQLLETRAAADAQVSINGLNVTSSNNVFADVIDGVTITAKAETTTAATVNVSENRTPVRQALEAFIEAYNTFNKTAKGLTKYDAENNKASVLTGDSTVRSAVSSLRRTLSDDVGSQLDGAFKALAEIGVIGSTDGTLSLDTDKLNDALDEDFAGVVDLARAFGESAGDVAGRFTGSEGLITARTDGIQQGLERVTEDRINLAERIEQIEARLTQQFAGLDSLLSDLNRQGDFLAQQLGSIPQPGQGNN